MPTSMDLSSRILICTNLCRDGNFVSLIPKTVRVASVYTTMSGLGVLMQWHDLSMLWIHPCVSSFALAKIMIPFKNLSYEISVLLFYSFLNVYSAVVHILQKENGQQYPQYVLPSLLRLTFQLLRMITRNFVIISFLCHNCHISKSTCEIRSKWYKRFKKI